MVSFTDEDVEQRQILLDSWLLTRREIARLQAREAALLAERMALLDVDVQENPYHRDTIHRSMIAEYSAAGHTSKYSVERAFADAAFLRSGHDAVRESFQRGAITAAHVHEIVEAAFVVREAITAGRADDATLDLYDIAAAVAAENDTPARTRVQVRQIAASLAGETLVERHRRAADERSVTMRSAGDGLALLQIVLPEHLAAAILDRLTQLAKHIIAARDDQEPLLNPDLLDAGPDPVFPEDLLADDPSLDDWVIFGQDDTFTTDPLLTAPLLTDRVLADVCGSATGDAAEFEHVPADGRTVDQIRADLVSDLLLAADPSGVRGEGADSILGRIQVTIAGSTLLGIDDRPAELDGFGPIDPDIARALAARGGGWIRLFLDSTGMITEADSYVPTAGMRRFLRGRDQRCRFPGCRMPVHRCQLDHNHDHAKGGRTAVDNLGHFCTGHHVLKHPDIDERHRWSAHQQADGTIARGSPLGRTYLDPAPRRVMFI